MKVSPHLQRAMVLQQQGRHQLAENELRQHLAAAPEDGFAMAVLAISLAEQERREEAEITARTAIGHAPDMPFCHYALARILTDRQRLDDALTAIREAIRLEPTDAAYHGMLAAIELNRERWKEALSAAETGLQFDPEHATCNNLRAMALVKLGRKTEAGATIRATLARDPDNALSHANQGWTLLEQGRRKEAMEHFRESLRLDPANDWARAGLLEALKAWNPLYAVMLKYFLWMQKLSDRARWGIVLGGYLGSRMLSGLARSHPDWSVWITPIQVAYISFVLLTWLAYPLFNLMLFVHPVGRYALDRDQRFQAALVGLCLFIAVGLLALSIGSPGAYLLPALVFGLLAIPTSAIFMCARGWPRTAMALITLGLCAAGISAAAIVSFGHPAKGSPAAQWGGGALALFLLGTFASQWIANWLASQRPER